MKWRFLLDNPQDAATNMGVDEALFLSALAGNAPPTVRLYTWSRPSVSIGFRQSMTDVCHWDACRRLGVDTVRRISGGRAVLHHHELTYCVAAPADGSFRGLPVLGIYRWIAEALRETFNRLNVTVDAAVTAPTPHPLHTAPAVKDSPLPCFAVPTGHEITAGGKKLVGSAQKWTPRGFLQHGSILLELEPDLWRRTTALPDGSDLGAVGVNDLAKRPVDASELALTLQKSFEERFGEPASTHAPSEREMQVAHILARTKYGSDSWNLHRRHGHVEELEAVVSKR